MNLAVPGMYKIVYNCESPHSKKSALPVFRSVVVVGKDQREKWARNIEKSTRRLLELLWNAKQYLMR